MKSSVPGCLVVLLAFGSAHAGESNQPKTESQLPAAFTNALGMEFVLIRPTTFTTGKTGDSKLPEIGGLEYDRSAAHKLTLTKPFYIQKHPVSERAYRQSGLHGSANDVSWYEAADFCMWLSNPVGRYYRLPTEAEWEWVFQSMPDGVRMENREWVQDWHGVLPPDDVTDPLGPITGMTKIIPAGAKR